MTIRNSLRAFTVVSVMVSSLTVLSLVSIAGAAGSSYGGSPTSVTGPTGESFPVSTALPTTGNAQKSTTTVGVASISVALPAGALPPHDQLIVGSSSSQPPPPGETHVVALFVGVYDNGTKVTTTFAHPVQVTIHSDTIKAGDTVVQYINGRWEPLVATVVNGVATVEVTSDPVIDIVHPPLATVAAIVRTAVTVRYGSVGASVKKAQVLLNRHGAKLAVDGIFGPKTLAAVRAFQHHSGLAANGVVADTTWKELAL